MKKLLLVLLALPFIGFGQFTYVPDNNFEQRLIYLGYDNVLDNYVTTASIDTVTYLNINNQGIADLTGISDFTALTSLYCSNNQLSSLNISQNTALTYLECGENPLGSLDVSQNTALTDLWCGGNQLSSLDLSQNTSLERLVCSNNQITSLDLSHNSVLYYFNIGNNPFTCLNIANGNSLNFSDCGLQNTPNLYCIEVDDYTNVVGNNTPDPQTYYSNNCNNACSSLPSSIQEQTTSKELLKVTDLLGRETKATNQLLFYIYNDGTVEKKVVVE